jgi:hypothetical protein
MKTIVPALMVILVAGSLSAHEALAIELKLNCASTQTVAAGKTTVTQYPVYLNDGSSQLFPIQFGADSNNSVLISLNETSKVCASPGCKNTNGSVYSLSLVRFENPYRKAAMLQADHKEKIKGATSSVIEFTEMNTGALTASYLSTTGAPVLNAEALPSTISIRYSVSRGVLKFRAKIEVSCEISVR